MKIKYGMLAGITSMAESALAQGETWTEIKEERTRYDELTGEPYLQYKVAGFWYDGRNGDCVSNRNLMFYLESIKIITEEE